MGFYRPTKTKYPAHFKMFWVLFDTAYYLLLMSISSLTLCFLYTQLTMGMFRTRVSLGGKVALVTGGNGGIGLETARGLAESGARVIIGCRYKEGGVAAVSDIIKTTGNKLVQFKILDLLSLESVKQFAEEINEEEAKIDILVNNAGAGKGSEPKRLPLEDNLSPDGLEVTTQTSHL